jgi:hypothetical protein
MNPVVVVTTRAYDNLDVPGTFSVGGNATFTGGVLIGSATGGMPSAGYINAKGFAIDGVPVSTSSSSYWNESAGTLTPATSSNNVALGADAATLKFGAAGDNIIGRAAATGIYISKGLHVGGTTDPGDNNLVVDGAAGITGLTTSAGYLTTNTDPTTEREFRIITAGNGTTGSVTLKVYFGGAVRTLSQVVW